MKVTFARFLVLCSIVLAGWRVTHSDEVATGETAAVETAVADGAADSPRAQIFDGLGPRRARLRRTRRRQSVSSIKD